MAPFGNFFLLSFLLRRRSDYGYCVSPSGNLIVIGFEQLYVWYRDPKGAYTLIANGDALPFSTPKFLLGTCAVLFPSPPPALPSSSLSFTNRTPAVHSERLPILDSWAYHTLPRPTSRRPSQCTASPRLHPRPHSSSCGSGKALVCHCFSASMR
jgi:hypothetical protein